MPTIQFTPLSICDINAWPVRALEFIYCAPLMNNLASALRMAWEIGHLLPGGQINWRIACNGQAARTSFRSAKISGALIAYVLPGLELARRSRDANEAAEFVGIKFISSQRTSPPPTQDSDKPTLMSLLFK